VSEETSRKMASDNEFYGDPVSASLKPVHELINDGRPQHSVKNANTRRSGIPGVGNIGWGEHLCAFYNRKQELLNLVVPFIQAGLQDNEFCLWITGEPVTERDAFEALEAVLPQAHEYLIRERLEILPYHQWYQSSGAFNGERVLENWISKARYAEANDCAGIRITGNAFWLQSEEEWAQFGCYEKKVEAAIRSERILALCTYPIERCSHDQAFHSLSNHGSTLLRRNNEWQRLELRRCVPLTTNQPYTAFHSWRTNEHR
jgi:hypothetical protein